MARLEKDWWPTPGLAVHSGERVAAREARPSLLFGVAVVVAPVVGPTLGGWLAYKTTWRWCFSINVPVGLATTGRERQEGRPVRRPALRPNLDLLGALELVLDRGLDDDWFGSNFIVAMSAICGLAFVLMVPREMTWRDPMTDLRMVATRQSCVTDR
jgi:DHA2 family multidrug resistance protein